MKAYLFCLNKKLDGRILIRKKEMEVDEKPKTYYYEKERRVFKKEDIGIVSGLFWDECFLLEDDISKAASAFVVEYVNDIEKLKSDLIKKERELGDLVQYINKWFNIKYVKRYIILYRFF